MTPSGLLCSSPEAFTAAEPSSHHQHCRCPTAVTTQGTAVCSSTDSSSPSHHPCHSPVYWTCSSQRCCGRLSPRIQHGHCQTGTPCRLRACASLPLAPEPAAAPTAPHARADRQHS